MEWPERCECHALRDVRPPHVNVLIRVCLALFLGVARRRKGRAKVFQAANPAPMVVARRLERVHRFVDHVRDRDRILVPVLVDVEAADRTRAPGDARACASGRERARVARDSVRTPRRACSGRGRRTTSRHCILHPTSHQQTHHRLRTSCCPRGGRKCDLATQISLGDTRCDPRPASRLASPWCPKRGRRLPRTRSSGPSK